ncbi:DUF341 domain-containing protein [Trichoderma chlorosporum]
MKILCLHGGGTSSQIFEIQTAAIRRELSMDSSFVFEFLEGNIAWPPPAGIHEFMPEATEFFGYYDLNQPTTITQAVDQLEEYVRSEGPFDGVIGFSQGAGLAAMLLMRAHNRVTPIFSFAIFFCGAGLFNTEALRRGELREFIPGMEAQKITVPTAHIIGSRDEVMLEHGGGHEIPLAPLAITRKIANVIRETITRSSLKGA